MVAPEAVLDIPETGNDFIDTHHRDLMEMVTALTEVWEAEKASRGFEGLARDFVDTLRAHFLREEMVLGGVGYQNIGFHEVSHENILYFLERQLDKGLDAITGQVFLDNLKSELFEHELVEDQDYWPLLDEDAPAHEPIIEWTAGLETGVDSVDAHHRALLRYINRLNDRILNGYPKKLILAELNQLYLFSAHHFREEELRFVSMKQADRQRHRRSHEKLLHDLHNLLQEYENDTFEAQSIGAYISYWLVNHLKLYDIPDLR